MRLTPTMSCSAIVALLPAAAIHATTIECATLSAGGVVAGQVLVVMGEPIVGRSISDAAGVSAGFLPCLGIQPPLLFGDCTQDGCIDGADLGILLGEWGACAPGCGCDLSGDGVVDGADLGMLLGAWGTCSPVQER